jgi:acetolactate synthase-1/2/3 large subunit
MFAASYFWETFSPREYLCSGGLATMGYALPGALGAWLHAPERPVVALTGDGGFLMNLPELATASRLRAHVVTVVFADQSLSLIRLKQAARGLAGDYLDVAAADWAQLAESFGLKGYRATTESEYERALSASLEGGEPTVLSVAVDPVGYQAASKLLRD